MYSTRGHSGTIRFNCILPQKLQPVFTLTPVTPSSKGCFSNRIGHRDIRGLPLGNLTGLSTLSNSRFHYRSFLSLFSFLFSRKKYRNGRKLFSRGNKKTRRHSDIFLASGWPLVGCENRSTQDIALYTYTVVGRCLNPIPSAKLSSYTRHTLAYSLSTT